MSAVGTLRGQMPEILKLAETTLAVVAVVIATAGCGVFGMSGKPPESAYTQAEAYPPMEQAIADTIEILPDFPGFTYRSWRELPCSHNGIDNSDYTNIEISYGFGEELSTDPKIRETYVDVLREHWAELGYTTRTDEGDDTGFYNLSVKREDGIALWYSVWGLVNLIVQSGCVPVSDIDEIEYVPPAGGIEPGSDGDIVDRYFPDGIPTEETTEETGNEIGDETTTPPDHATSTTPSGTMPWQHEPNDPDGPAPGRYDGLL